MVVQSSEVGTYGGEGFSSARRSGPRRGWWGAFLVAISLALVWNAPAQASKRQDKRKLAEGEDLYFSGNYEEALFMLEELAQQEKVDQQIRVKALKYIAFCYFLLEAKEQAKEAWYRILEIEPGYKLNDVDESPEFVKFFNPIEAGQTGGGEAEGGGSEGTGEGDAGEGGEDGAGTAAGDEPEVINAKTGEAEGGTQVKKEIPPPHEEIENERGCGIVLCLIPGGIGQYANGQIVKGIIFTTLEAALLGLNIGFYYWNESERDPTTNTYRDIGAATDRYWAQIGFFIGAVATAIFGVIDAFVFY